MKYVVTLEIDEEDLEGDDSIENACRIVNTQLGDNHETPWYAPRVAPLSETFSC